MLKLPNEPRSRTPEKGQSMKNTLETVDGVEYCAPTRRVIREHAHLQGGDLVPAFLAELRQVLHAEDVSSGGRYQRSSLMTSSVMLHSLS
jgi:hypothetical protein